MESWRFILGATIHAVIVAGAIVYAGERLSASNNSDGAVGAAGAKMAAVPVNQAPINPAPPSFLEGAELIERVRAPEPKDYVYGDSESPVKLISYFDVNCTFCRRFYSVAKSAVDESDGLVSWDIRHYPLNDQSPSAKWAKVPECLAEQKGSAGFFAFFDKVYLEDAPLNESLVSDFVSSLDIDKSSYEACLDSEEVASRIERDINEGQSIDIQGTPTTVVYSESNENAILRMGHMPIEQLRRLIEQVK